jgi:transposase-like protein
MKYCPDCEAAKISQQNRLIRKHDIFICPDCEGELIGDRWHSAPKYPNGKIDEWQILMGMDKVCTVRKVNGVWKNRTTIRVS